MAKIWPEHGQGFEGKKNWAASPLKHTFTLYTKSPPLRVTTKLNQCHFHAPCKENNQIGKFPTSCSVWDQVLDPSTLQQWGLVAFPPHLPSFLPSFLFFLSFSLFFLLLLSTNCLESLFKPPSWFDIGGGHLTLICLTLGQL